MEMIKMPSGEPLCLLYAAAMVLNVEPNTLKHEGGYSSSPLISVINLEKRVAPP